MPGGNTSLEATSHKEQENRGIRVPVNEDFLFDVDIEKRELAPAYWLGPVYEGWSITFRISLPLANS
jgi:hypothetical protein